MLRAALMTTLAIVLLLAAGPAHVLTSGDMLPTAFPVVAPEPSTEAMLLAGACMLGLIVHRRMR